MDHKHIEEPQTEQEAVSALVKITRYVIYITLLFAACVIMVLFALLSGHSNTPLERAGKKDIVSTSNSKDPGQPTAVLTTKELPANAWKAPDINKLPEGKDAEMIRYGRELVAHTAKYLGPQGSVVKITNGMNCQNCHLEAGTKYLGNNYSAVYATYPKFRARSGTNETVIKRISDCFQRSLNGTAPDSSSKEMKAMVAYIKFLGTDVKKGSTPVGAGLEKLAYLDRPADPEKGAALYRVKCVACHGTKGEGVLAADKKLYTYPPLWGAKSYNDGAGLYRLSNFAGYIKNNMPLGATYESPQLTSEEAWDIAAFVNSQARPHKDQKSDWTDISKKPVDFAYAPYADKFSESQHKYGPFGPIKEAHEQEKLKSSK